MGRSWHKGRALNTLCALDALSTMGSTSRLEAGHAWPWCVFAVIAATQGQSHIPLNKPLMLDSSCLSSFSRNVNRVSRHNIALMTLCHCDICQMNEQLVRAEDLGIMGLIAMDKEK